MTENPTCNICHRRGASVAVAMVLADPETGEAYATSGYVHGRCVEQCARLVPVDPPGAPAPAEVA